MAYNEIDEKMYQFVPRDERWGSVLGLVQATEFEQNHIRENYCSTMIADTAFSTIWNEHRANYRARVGSMRTSVGDEHVLINMRFVDLDGVLTVFYSMEGTLYNGIIVQDFWKKMFPNWANETWRNVRAENFEVLFSSIRQLNMKRWWNEIWDEIVIESLFKESYLGTPNGVLYDVYEDDPRGIKCYVARDANQHPKIITHGFHRIVHNGLNITVQEYTDSGIWKTAVHDGYVFMRTLHEKAQMSAPIPTFELP